MGSTLRVWTINPSGENEVLYFKEKEIGTIYYISGLKLKGVISIQTKFFKLAGRTVKYNPFNQPIMAFVLTERDVTRSMIG